MMTPGPAWAASAIVAAVAAVASAQDVGTIRGFVRDADFDAPVANAQVLIRETGRRVAGDESGNFTIADVPAGTYTLVISKDGYAREIRTGVVVAPGRLTEVDVDLAGEFVDMDEFIAQDVRVGGTSEEGLLRLRLDSPALLDSVGRDLISRAGASDAAGALRLVSGASLQDGKFAVVRGLPDRYVVSLLNGIRLPSADEDTRAVELDLFPTAVLQALQVSKTFTPDQQGDTSGGGVNILLRGIPEETILTFRMQYTYNTQTSGRNDFLTYKGGGLNFWGDPNTPKDIQVDNLGRDWTGAVGVSRGGAPVDLKWSFDAGGSAEIADGVRIGGFQSFFWERDSQYYSDGIDRSYWVTEPGQGMVPRTNQGLPDPGDNSGDYRTALFDVTRGVEAIQWGWLGTAGIETENNYLGVTFLYTRTAEDSAILAEDQNGKDYFFPGYDLDDPESPGNAPSNRFAAPWLRTETLTYTDRRIQTLAFNGRHTLPIEEFGVRDALMFQGPTLDWTIATSIATLNEPDKIQFGSIYVPPSLNPGFPPFVPPFVLPGGQFGYKPDANFLLGNLQRTFKYIEEESSQFSLNITVPFTQWTDDEGFVKFGTFYDKVNRRFDQENFSNFNDQSSFDAPWNVFWSEFFPLENHPITDGPPFIDVDYNGQQRITAWYAMADLPVTSFFNVIGGVRWESTDIGIQNFPEADATWFPPGATAPVQLNPGDADVAISQQDALPSIGFVFKPVENVFFRGAFSETIARPVFKELTPIQQQEFLGGDIFIGNPDLQLSSLRNYDLRLDYSPYPNTIFSVSWFWKDLTNPIEYVQRVAPFTYTTPLNFPKGRLWGWEFEARQDLGQFWEPLSGLVIGGNATLINSRVELPQEEIDALSAPGIEAPQTFRDMTNAPDYIYNIFASWDARETGTQVGLFYNVRGDTLLAGAGTAEGNFIPSVYALESGTLNFTISQKFLKYFALTFQAKNLTNPRFEEVYRSPYIGNDVLKRSFSLGIDYAVGITCSITF
ncbi:MAG TPA: TonB-dependent receptor [Phycisphaerales bacterium]|nr:TonB-dependent receptor [Phycisphaerales bacterium]HMP38142.1 TonB-dependent receptor [Phycisphaerales bacterium]